MKKSALLLVLLGLSNLGTQRLLAHEHHDHYHDHVEISIGERPHYHYHEDVVVVGGPQYVVLENEPPADMEEVVSACPGPDYCWIRGNWSWDGRWIWRGGRWERRPHAEAVWVPGGWNRGGERWEFRAGYWR